MPFDPRKTAWGCRFTAWASFANACALLDLLTYSTLCCATVILRMLQGFCGRCLSRADCASKCRSHSQ
eukprot:10711911-Prorocentrum_lima.AAC.1